MGEIKAELNAELQTHIAFEIPLFGGIPVPESAVVSWAIIVVLTLLAIWLTHGLRKRPGRKQIAAEMLVGFINNFCRDTLGDKYWRTFAPYLGTVGLYLALANMAGLFGVTPPTKDLNVTAGLAIMSALLIYGSQFRFHGLLCPVADLQQLPQAVGDKRKVDAVEDVRRVLPIPAQVAGGNAKVVGLPILRQHLQREAVVDVLHDPVDGAGQLALLV